MEHTLYIMITDLHNKIDTIGQMIAKQNETTEKLIEILTEEQKTEEEETETRRKNISQKRTEE